MRQNNNLGFLCLLTAASLSALCCVTLADERQDVLTALESSGRYFQISDSKCGPYSTYLACRHLGKDVTFSEIESALPRDAEGNTNLLSIKKYLEGQSVSVSAQKFDNTSEIPADRGLILVLKRLESGQGEERYVRHFAFALTQGDSHVVIFDPVLKVGKSVVTRSDLTQVWTGECLLLP